MYVGMTRAKKKLSLYSASQRFRFNQYMYNDVSRFVMEIPKKYLQVSGVDDWDQDQSQDQYQDQDLYEGGASVIRRRARSKGRDESEGYNDSYYDYENGEDFVGSRAKLKKNKGSMQYMYQDQDTQRYGKGTVLKVQGGWSSVKLVVNFPGYGARKLKMSDVKLR